MSLTIREPMSREAFFEWAEAQEERYEFDGEQPVLMTGGLVGHSRLQFRLMTMLTTHLSGTPFEALAPDAGLATTGQRIRYPDAVVTRGFTQASARIVNDPVAVFEIVSPATSSVDRIVKLREYGAVETIRTYAILETESPAAMLFHKLAGEQWTATALTKADTLAIPVLGIELRMAELYTEAPG